MPDLSSTVIMPSSNQQSEKERLQQNVCVCENYIKTMDNKQKYLHKEPHYARIGKKSSANLLFLIIAFLCFRTAQSVSSIPLTYYDHPNIESRMVSIAYFYSYYRQATVPFLKVKATELDYDDVFMSVKEMDYDVNRYQTWGNNVPYLYFSINYWTSATSINIYCYHYEYRISTITVSLIIFDNQLPERSMIDSYSAAYYSGDMTESILLQSTSNYTFMKFIRYCSIMTNGPGQNSLDVQTTQTLISPYLESTVSTVMNNYQSFSLEVRFLIVYLDRVPQGKMVLQYRRYSFVSTAVGFNMKYYSSDVSFILLGLSSFSYQTQDDPANQGFKWTSTLQDSSSSSSFSLFVILNMDEQFTRLSYNFFIINFIACSNPDFTLRANNPTNGKEQCFDQCYESQFVKYQPVKKYLTCAACADPLCRTCDGPSRCSSCRSFYDLDELGVCILNAGYYQDAMNNIFPCNNNLTACTSCSSDGSTCNECLGDHFLLSGVCNTCSGIDLQCILCTSTTCLQCQTPQVLINQTFCSSPINLPSNPPQHLPCSDPYCLGCSQTNVSNCLMCNSNFLTLRDGQCISVCGDGLIAGYDICDDGNNFDFDGCSSDCMKVEDGFQCGNVPSILTGFDMSDCYFNRKIQIKVFSIKKDPNANSLKLILKNSQTNIKEWMQIQQFQQLKKIINVRIPRFEQEGAKGNIFNFTCQFIKSPDLIKQIKNKFQKSTSEPSSAPSSRLLQSSQPAFNPSLYEYLSLQIDYSLDPSLQALAQQSLNHQLAQISFKPALSQRRIFSSNPSFLNYNLSFRLITDDNQIIQYFPQQYYQGNGQIFILSLFVSFMTVLGLVIAISSFFIDGTSSKQLLICLQTAYIVQFTYFSLIQIGELNPLFINVSEGLKYSSGYDISLIGDFYLKRQLFGLQISSFHISDNLNVSLILTFVVFLLGGIGLISNKVLSRKNQKNNKNNQNFKNSSEPESQQGESKCSKILNYLFFNLGFALVLFFLYKSIFFSAIQFKYGISSLQTTDIVVLLVFGGILIGYIALLIIKFQFFSTFIQKVQKSQNPIKFSQALAKNPEISSQTIKRIEKRFQQYLDLLPQSDKPQHMRKVKLQRPIMNPKKMYILAIFIQHLVNCLALVFLSQIMLFHAVIPLILYACNLILACRYKFYQRVNLGRLCFTYFVGIFVQGVFIARNIMMQTISSKVGGQQTSLGLYFPYSVVFMLAFLCLTSLVYIIYSIKKTRCCQLEIQWERVQLSVAMKLKLESLIEQQNSEQKQVKAKAASFGPQLSQNTLIYEQGSIIDQSNFNIINDEFSSFKSHDNRPFFDLPFKIKRPIKGILSMIDDSKFQKRTLNRINAKINQRNDGEIDYDVPLNQQVTLKTLKKQIRQKLSISQISQKIRTMGQDRMETALALKMLKQKQSIQKPIGYIYTDAQVYDMTEQFDMI